MAVRIQPPPSLPKGRMLRNILASLLLVILASMGNMIHWSRAATRREFRLGETLQEPWDAAIPTDRAPQYTTATRAAQAARHFAQAQQTLDELQQRNGDLDLSDLRYLYHTTNTNTNTVHGDSSPWTPAALENMVQARRFYQSAAAAAATNANANANTNASTTENAWLHYFCHIPKTGVSEALEILYQTTTPHRSVHFQQFLDQWIHAAEATSNNNNNNNKNTTLFHRWPPPYRFRPCDVGMDGDFSRHPGHFRGSVCTLWISEASRPTFPTFRYAYTLIRNPRQHVLSQYFHCKESIPHQSISKHMPHNITQWLEAWVNKMHETNTTSPQQHHQQQQQQQQQQQVVGNQGLDPIYQCYDPRNLQTKFTNFGRAYWNVPLPDIMTFPHPEEESIILEQIRNDLQERFNVVGLTDRVAQSTCMISIQYTGWVPPECDCTERTRAQVNSTTTISLQGKDHGVQHHGATYPTTPEQDVLLDHLTQWDQLLYRIAQEMFWKRLKETQDEYGVQICTHLRSKNVTA